MKKTDTNSYTTKAGRRYESPRLTVYRRPQMVRYGSMGELTQFGAGSGREVGSTYST